MVREVVLFIHGVLEQDQQAPRKQRHTAQRMFERLREEMPGCEVSAQQFEVCGPGVETAAAIGTE
jgi:hypothetical protein